jgi:DNA-binding GntR family transcriptional regulator
MFFNYRSLKDHVYEYLYVKINSGVLKPKDKINENQLCKDLNVSRTPIREALIQLEDEGYITRVPRRGFIVREISPEKIKDIYDIVGCLEGRAAALAIDKLTEKDFTTLRDLIRRMEQAITNKRTTDYFKIQRMFHDVYITACGNRELSDLVGSLKKRFVKKAYFLYDKEEVLYQTLERNNVGHKKILELLENGDKAGVETFLRDVHWNYEQADLIISPFESGGHAAR